VVLKLDEHGISAIHMRVVAMWHSPNVEDLLYVVVMCHSMSGEDSPM